MKTVLLTLNYNTAKECILLIFGILNSKHIDKIVILDNGSNIDDFNKLNSYINKINKPEFIILEKSDTNLGLAGGFDLLLKKYQDFDNYIITNSDIIIFDDSIKILLNELNTGIKPIVVAPIVNYYENGIRTNRKQSIEYKDIKDIKINFKLMPSFKKKIDTNVVSKLDLNKRCIRCFSTSPTCFIVPKKVIRQIGLFDDNFFIFHEDTDFFLRLRFDNTPLILIPSAKVWHPAHSSSSDDTKDFLVYHRIRSSLIFYRKYKHILRIKYIINYTIYTIFKIIQNVFNFKRMSFIFKGYYDGLFHKIRKQKLPITK